MCDVSQIILGDQTTDFKTSLLSKVQVNIIISSVKQYIGTS